MPVTDPTVPSDIPEFPGVEPVDPVAPASDVMVPSDGPEVPAAEQDMPVVEPAVRFPPEIAAVRTTRRQLATHHIPGPDDVALRTLGRTRGQTCSLAREISATDGGCGKDSNAG